MFLGVHQDLSKLNCLPRGHILTTSVCAVARLRGDEHFLTEEHRVTSLALASIIGTQATYCLLELARSNGNGRECTALENIFGAHATITAAKALLRTVTLGRGV